MPRALLLLLLCAGCAIPFHARTKAKRIPAPSAGLPYEWVEVPAGEGVVLRGIYSANDGPPVLVLYGSGMGIAGSIEIVQMLRDAGYSVLCCDYRGTGYSSGKWGTSRFLDDDARALWEWMTARHGRPAGVLGVSVGSVAASGLLSLGTPPEAVVLDRLIDPKTVAGRYIEKELGPFSRFITDLFFRTTSDVDVARALAGARAPTLVLLPEYDVLCPPPDADRLTRGRAETVRLKTVRGGHLSAHLVDPVGWRSALLDFLDDHLRPGLPHLGGRLVPPDPIGIETATIDEKGLLTVRLAEGPLPKRATLLVCGRRSSAVIVFENPGRVLTYPLPPKVLKRVSPLLGAHVMHEGFRSAIGAKWINARPPPPPGAPPPPGPETSRSK